jgi:mannan endo-1,4-beta-mannosidase
MIFDGTQYSAELLINREGNVTVSVVLGRRGGLWAEYFNNVFLSGIPALQRVDSVMNFNWSSGTVTPSSGDYVSVHWYGNLLAPASEDFTFVLSGDEGFRFKLKGKLLIDRWETCCDDMTVTVPLVRG